MNYLTKQERLVIYVVLSLLAVGQGVKVYRSAHPVVTAVQTVKP